MFVYTCIAIYHIGAMFAYVVCINSTCSCLYISRCSHIEAACMGFLPFVHGFLFIYMSLALTQTDPMHALLGSLFLSLYIYNCIIYCTLYIAIYIPVYIYVYRCVYIYIYTTVVAWFCRADASVEAIS